MCIRLADLLGEIIGEYGLKKKAEANEFMYVEIQKGMYDLPEAKLLVR